MWNASDICNQKQNDWPNSAERNRHPWMQRKQSDHGSSDSDPSLWLKILLSECSQALIHAERRYEKVSKKTGLFKRTTESKARCKLGMGQRSEYKNSFAVSKLPCKIYASHTHPTSLACNKRCKIYHWAKFLITKLVYPVTGPRYCCDFC